MRHIRRAARVDNNQKAIVKALRDIPNVTVQLGHDDILVGHTGKDGIPRTYWYEIKNKDGFDKLQPSQVELLDSWKGHYKVVHTLDEILEDLKIKL